MSALYGQPNCAFLFINYLIWAKLELQKAGQSNSQIWQRHTLTMFYTPEQINAVNIPNGDRLFELDPWLDPYRYEIKRRYNVFYMFHNMIYI